MRRAPGVQLVALYAVEHGLYNEMPAEKPFGDKVDPRTGLPVYSLYNGKTRNFVPTRAQLAGITGPGQERGPDIRDLTALLWCSIDNDDSLDLDQLTVCELLAKSDIYTLRRIVPEDRGQKWS